MSAINDKRKRWYLQRTPAFGFQCEVDIFGAGFGFVHNLTCQHIHDETDHRLFSPGVGFRHQ